MLAAGNGEQALAAAQTAADEYRAGGKAFIDEREEVLAWMAARTSP